MIHTAKRFDLFDFVICIFMLFLLCGSVVNAQTIEAGYNDNNGDTSGYLDYSYSKNNYSASVGFIHKDKLTSTDVSGRYKDSINESYDILVTGHFMDNPRLNITTLSTRLGLDYILLLDNFTLLNAGYGLDAMAARNQKTLFSIYYDLSLLIDFDEFKFEMGTFGNQHLKKHTAEASYKFKRLRSTEANLKYALTDYQGRIDYMLTTGIKTEF